MRTRSSRAAGPRPRRPSEIFSAEIIRNLVKTMLLGPVEPSWLRPIPPRGCGNPSSVTFGREGNELFEVYFVSIETGIMPRLKISVGSYFGQDSRRRSWTS